MDHPPREMKETLFTRHNQTVLPLLANTKKESLRTIHTSFGNTAIDNLMDNRVLNNRRPPVNDEEIYLTRRQRATLSQIRSGHCKLFKLSRLWNGSAGCSSLVQVHCSPHRFDTRKFMEQTCQDDTRTELSRPGEAGITTRMGENAIQQRCR